MLSFHTLGLIPWSNIGLTNTVSWSIADVFILFKAGVLIEQIFLI